MVLSAGGGTSGTSSAGGVCARAEASASSGTGRRVASDGVLGLLKKTAVIGLTSGRSSAVRANAGASGTGRGAVATWPSAGDVGVVAVRGVEDTSPTAGVGRAGQARSSGSGSLVVANTASEARRAVRLSVVESVAEASRLETVA